MSKFTIVAKPTFKRVGKAFRDIAEGFNFQKEIEKFAFAIERESKRKSPVDTGRMRASIATNVGNLQASIGPHVDYALFVHEGTRYMSGRPFLSWGADIAERNLYGGKPPFVTHIEGTIGKHLVKLR